MTQEGLPVAEFETVDQAVAALEAKDVELTKVKAKNQDLIGEKRDVQEKLRAFGEMSPSEAKRLSGLETELNTKSKNVDERLTALRTEFDGKLAAKDTEIASLTEGLSGATITTQAHEALAAFGGNADLLMDRIKRDTTLMEIDGKRVPVVVGDDGKPKVSPNPKTVGQPMTVRELVEDMSKDERLAGAFAGTGSSGGGAANQGHGGAGPVVVGASEVLAPTLDQLKAQESGALGVDLSR